MLYKKSVFGRKYIRLLTGSWTLFTAFVLLGVGIFLFLTMTTKIDIINTYSAKIITMENEITLSSKAANIEAGLAYIYINKNEAVYSVSIINAENIRGTYTLHFNSKDQNTIKALQNEKIFIDIPQGKETLLYRIFAKGGKNLE
jgi:hypothetical protein